MGGNRKNVEAAVVMSQVSSLRRTDKVKNGNDPYKKKLNLDPKMRKIGRNSNAVTYHNMKGISVFA